MFYTSFKIYIIDPLNNENSSTLQDIAIAALNRSVWIRKPEIISVTINSVSDWMPAGNIQMQDFGPLKIMYNYEADLTEDVIQTMTQISKTVNATFKSNPKLRFLRALDSDEIDAELDKTFLDIQQTIGKNKYAEIQLELTQATTAIMQREKKFLIKSNTALLEILNNNRLFLERSTKAAMPPRDDLDQRKEQVSRIKADYNNRLNVIGNNLHALKCKAQTKLTPLRLEAARLRLFAKNIAEGYRVSHEAQAEVCRPQLQAPTPCSSSKP